MRKQPKRLAGGTSRWFKGAISAASRFFKLLYPLSPGGRRIISAVIILAAVWAGFVYLTDSQPANASSALIMTWASGVVLAFAFFPKLFHTVKRFKFKDVEIEFDDSVSQSYLDNIIKFDQAKQLAGEKEGFDTLVKLVEQSHKRDHTSILLTVNVRQDHYISILMLYVYVHYLMENGPITLLFVSSPYGADRTPADAVIGTASGEKFIAKCNKQWSHLQITENGNLKRYAKENFDYIYNQLKLLNKGDIILTRKLLNEAFSDLFSYAVVNESRGNLDFNQLHYAFLENKEYIVATKQGAVFGVLAASEMAVNIAKNMLMEWRRAQ